MLYAFFEKLVAPFPPDPPSPPPSTLFALCRYYARGSERYLVLMSLLTGSVAIIEISLFGFLGTLVDWLGEYSPTELWREKGGTLLGMGSLLVVFLPLVITLHALIVHQTLLGNFPMAIRWLAHRHLLRQSLGFYQQEFAGRLATKVMQTALAVRETILKLLDVLLYIGVYFTGLVVLVASLDWRLAMPFLIWLAMYVAILKYFLPKLERVSSKQADARSDMTGRIVDTYTNIMTVKLFSHSKRESSYARDGMENFLNTVHPQMRLATALSVTVWCCNCLLAFSVSALSIWLWSGSILTAGAIAAAMGLVFRLFGMSQWVMWEISALFENIGTARDGLNTLKIPLDVQDPPEAYPLTINQQAMISFERVRFHYGKGHGVIDDFSLQIQPGEKVGLVGRSGAGKSTLVNLLLRFYELEGGAIKINEHNIANITQDSLRANIGVVTQDTSLLHRSIRENIAYGSPNASDDAMINAAKQAHSHEFIQTLADAQGRRGYDAHAGERGVTLSGGQRQRIAIARVLLKNAPILVLDEATSALDSEVEQAIQENLKTLMQGKTVIAVAHRLSTIAALDRLVVIDGGKIVEQGDHRSLIRLGGIYAKLWKHQSGGFIGED